MKSCFWGILLLGLMLPAISQGADPHAQNRKLGRGINLGNWLEAPHEGAWGVMIGSNQFALIKEAGFQSVRIPIRWSTAERTAVDSPFVVADTFLERVDWAIDNALSAGLAAVINVHHYDALFEDPEEQRERFLAMWTQIAERYRNKSASLFFEILNEPHGNLTAEKWNSLLREALQIVRRSNPDRTLIIGTAEWGGPSALAKLDFPEDGNLILTVHYYNPFEFTHQGASWVEGMDADSWLGTTWDGGYWEKKAIVDELQPVLQFSKKRGVPVYLGEFGAYSKADMASRARWTAYCARLFEKLGFSWAYWEFSSGFGAYDPGKMQWREPLLQALISSDTSMLALTPPDISGGNLLQNGDFSQGKQSWIMGAWKGSAEFSVSDGVLQVAIAELPPNAWEVQLLQAGLSLKEGAQYVLEFTAWADEPRLINAGVEADTTGYRSYASMAGVSLETEPRTFSRGFTMPVDENNARVSFSLGAQAPRIHIDQVRLVRVDRSGQVGLAGEEGYAWNAVTDKASQAFGEKGASLDALGRSLMSPPWTGARFSHE